MEKADLILLLVSPAFLASDYCYDVETARALERHALGEARAIPVIVRPCDWASAPFADLQALPRDGQAVTTWANRDEAWLDVTRGLRGVIPDLRRDKASQHQEKRIPRRPLLLCIALVAILGLSLWIGSALSWLGPDSLLQQARVPDEQATEGSATPAEQPPSLPPPDSDQPATEEAPPTLAEHTELLASPLRAPDDQATDEPPETTQEWGPGEGTCVGYRFPLAPDGQSTDSAIPLRVVRHGAKVYKEMSGNKVSGRAFHFGDSLYVAQISQSADDGMIKVRPVGARDEIGWMKREDLLCRIRPLKNSKGLERKLFVKTPAMLRDERLAVSAYDSPDSARCLGGNCLELSRFEMRFIYATAWRQPPGQPRQLRYLVAEHASLESRPRLTGWVDAESVIPWDTTLGLRPRIEAGRLEILPRRGSQSLAEVLGASHQDEGVELEGGNQWFRFDKRIAVLGLDELNGRQYYRVAFPGVGVEAQAADQAIEQAQKLKRVDVFFLIDGTRSMEPFIRSVKKVVIDIANVLSNLPGFEESYFRFGFRIYRDSSFGEDSTGEGLPLDKSTDSCGNEPRQSVGNLALFLEEIHEVRATSNPWTEGTDNESYGGLFNGLRKAVADLEGCPDHWKLLFVIGDAGDKEAPVPQDVIKGLLRYRQIVPFFIRAKHQGTVPEAYDRFFDQGRTILRGVLPDPLPLTGEALDVESQLFELTDSDLSKQVLWQVATYGNSTRANDVIMAFSSGQPLDQILRGLMREDRQGDTDLPILYWQRARNLICGDDATRCTQRVTHNVMEGYVEVTEDWVEELWLPESDLNTWLGLLQPLTRLEGKLPSEMKKEFVDVLVNKLEMFLGPPKIRLAGETIQEFLERRGRLPSRELSPLMQYTLQEILEVDHCELARLVLWVKQIREILLRVSANPTIRVAFELQPYPDAACPAISDKGKRLQRVVLETSPEPLGDSDEYRYSHTYLGESRYWLPKEFLP